MPTDMHQLPREEFIERNLGLVHACAGRFKGRGIEYEELYAAGCLGLVKACDGFDTGRGGTVSQTFYGFSQIVCRTARVYP